MELLAPGTVFRASIKDVCPALQILPNTAVPTAGSVPVVFLLVYLFFLSKSKIELNKKNLDQLRDNWWKKGEMEEEN